MRLSSPGLEIPALTGVTFEDPDADVVPGIIGGASAPQPLEPPRDEAALHAARAGLVSGESVTVVLSVEVRSDGSVGQVSLLNPSGNSSVDLEAMAFARSVHWVPGTVNRHATAMRVQYTMTLSATG
jgi:TonB family protein